MKNLKLPVETTTKTIRMGAFPILLSIMLLTMSSAAAQSRVANATAVHRVC
jgi:hypothetical protein